MLIKIFLGYLFLFWGVYGVYCFLDPVALSEFAGVAVTNSAGMVELKAMYGGAQMAIGFSCLLALMKPEFTKTTLFMQLILVTGLGTARLLAMIIESSWDAYNIPALVFEFSTVLFCILFLRQETQLKLSE